MVIGNGLEVCPLAVAVMVTSPGAELNAVPELVTVMLLPDVAERFTLFAPAVTAQVVEGPPSEERVMLVSYPEGVAPPNHQTTWGPEMVGLMFTGSLSGWITQ